MNDDILRSKKARGGWTAGLLQLTNGVAKTEEASLRKTLEIPENSKE